MSVHVISEQEEHWQKVDTSCCVLPLLECPSSFLPGGNKFLLWQGDKYEAHARQAGGRKRKTTAGQGGAAANVSEARPAPKRRRRNKGPEVPSQAAHPDAEPGDLGQAPLPDAVPSGHDDLDNATYRREDLDLLDPYGLEPDDEQEEAAARAAAQDAAGRDLLDAGVSDLLGADFSETHMLFSDLDLGYFLDAEQDGLSDDPEEYDADAASETSMNYEPSEPGEDPLEVALRLSAHEADQARLQSLQSAGAAAAAAASSASGAAAVAAGLAEGTAERVDLEDSEARAAAARTAVAKSKATASGRRPDFSKVEVSVPGVGKLRYYPHSQELQAVCDHPDHSDCRMSRTTRSFARSVKPQTVRYGQGRPLGLLTCWLRAQFDHSDQQSHLHSFVHTAEARREARRWLYEQISAEDADKLRSFERSLREGESEEPDKVS